MNDIKIELDRTYDALNSEDCMHICMTLFGVPMSVRTECETLPTILHDTPDGKKEVVRYNSWESIFDYLEKCAFTFRKMLKDDGYTAEDAPKNHRAVVTVVHHDPNIPSNDGGWETVLSQYDFQGSTPKDEEDAWLARFKPVYDHFIEPLSYFTQEAIDARKEVEKAKREAQKTKIIRLWQALGGTYELISANDCASSFFREDFQLRNEEFWYRTLNNFFHYCEGRFGAVVVRNWRKLASDAEAKVRESATDEDEDDEDDDDFDYDILEDLDLDDAEDLLEEDGKIPEEAEDLLEEKMKQEKEKLEKIVREATKGDPERELFLRRLMTWNEKFKKAKRNVKGMVNSCFSSPKEFKIPDKIGEINKSINAMADALFSDLISILPQKNKNDGEKKKDDEEKKPKERYKLEFRKVDGWKHRVFTITDAKGEVLWSENVDLEGLVWMSNGASYTLPLPQFVRDLLLSPTCADVFTLLVNNDGYLEGDTEYILQRIRNLQEENSRALLKARKELLG